MILTTILALTLLLLSCTNEGGTTDNNQTDTPKEWGDERSYVFDMTSVPEITMTLTLDEWNRLLAEYDRNNDTNEYFHCDVDITLKGEKYSITDAGVRLKGNTSRRRPEAGSGEHKTMESIRQIVQTGNTATSSSTSVSTIRTRSIPCEVCASCI